MQFALQLTPYLANANLLVQGLFLYVYGGDGGSDRPQGFARRTSSSTPRTVAFGPHPVRRFTGPAHLRLCPHWLQLTPPTPIFSHRKTGTRPVSLCLLWRWRFTIHYHGKCKKDNLSKTGTAPDLTLILIINLKVFCKVTFRIISASIKLMSGTSAFFRYSQF